MMIGCLYRLVSHVGDTLSFKSTGSRRFRSVDSTLILMILILFSVSGSFGGTIRISETGSVQNEPKTILFLGDSITAGYGLDENQAFPALIQDKIEETRKNYRVINAGLSGETSSGGLRRIGWLLRSPVDILVLELGANDGLRGIDLAVTEKNLQGIIDQTREKYPDVKVVVAGMQVPPNLGERYTTEFRELFPRLALTNNAVLIPFLLEGVAGEAHLNLPDGIHPTAEGHAILAANVWKTIEPLL